MRRCLPAPTQPGAILQTTVDELTRLRSGRPEEKRRILTKVARTRSPGALKLLFEALGDPEWPIRRHACEEIVAFGPQVIEALAHLLASGSEDQKYWAVRALVRLGEDAVPVLIRGLSRGTKSMRMYAASALGEIADPVAIPDLVKALGDSVWRVRRNSYEALVGMGGPALPELRKAIFSENEDIAFWSARALGKLGEKSRDVLLTALKTGSTQLKFIIAAALGETGDTRVVHLLLNNLTDGSWLVQRRSAEALAEIGPVGLPAMMKALRTGGETSTYWITHALTRMGDPGIKALSEALVDEGEDFRWNIKETLGRIGEPILPVCQELVSHPDVNVRVFAVSVIGDLAPSTESDGSLLEALRDESWTIRKIAADLLAARGAAVVDRLALSMETGDEDLRYWVTYVFRKMGGLGQKYLIRALQDPNKSIAYFAASALGEVQNREVVVPLVRALGDPYWPIRKVASESLARLAKYSVPHLINHINDEDPNVQHWVVETLRSIGSAATGDIVQLLKRGNDEQRFFAARALGVVHDPVAVAALVEALTDGNEWVRLYSALALGQQGDSRAIRHLVVSLGDPSFKLHQSIEDVFLKFGERAVPELLLGLKNANPRVVKNSLVLLGRLKAPAALEYLKSYLDHQDESYRLAAIQGLAGYEGEEGTLPLLIGQLQSSLSEELRQGILAALGRIGRPVVVEPLIQILEVSTSPREHALATDILLGLGETACPILVQLLGSSRVTARKAAAGILSSLGEMARPYLEAASKKGDPNVGYWVAKVYKSWEGGEVSPGGSTTSEASSPPAPDPKGAR